MIKNIIAFFLISTTSWAQTIIQSDPIISSNHVKTRIQLECNSDFSDCYPFILSHYDREGKITLKKTYEKGKLTETLRYEYTPAGYVNNIFVTYPGSKEFLNTKYTFNHQDRMISQDICYANQKCEPFEKYKYRKDGKLDSKTRYKDGVYFYEYRNSYDSKGNISQILILSNDSDSGEKEKRFYDENNLHIRSLWIDYLGEPIDEAEYSYNEKGQMIKNEWIGGLTTQKLYEFDEHGNNTRYTSIDYMGDIDDLREMKYDGTLIQSRTKSDGNKITNYWKFEYEKWDFAIEN